MVVLSCHVTSYFGDGGLKSKMQRDSFENQSWDVVFFELLYLDSSKNGKLDLQDFVEDVPVLE